MSNRALHIVECVAATLLTVSAILLTVLGYGCESYETVVVRRPVPVYEAVEVYHYPHLWL